jgi:hypothetical protein
VHNRVGNPLARLGRPVSAAVTAVVLCTSILITACSGSTRSIAAVCHVWDTDGLALHEKFEDAANGEKAGDAEGMIAGLVSIVGAPNELSRLMSEMAGVAPSSAEPDFEAVASSFKKLSESEGKALTDPLHTLGANIIDAVAVSGSYRRVDAFLAKNCGIPGR